MGARYSVLKMVVVAVTLAGAGVTWVASAESAEAVVWPPDVGCPNSIRVTTGARPPPGAPLTSRGEECIANYSARSNRGRLEHLINPARANIVDEVYDVSEGFAEYVAQGRLIAKVSGGSTTAVSASYQWETSMPGDGRRLDVMQYDPSSAEGDVKVLELKGDWNDTIPEAAKQADGYILAIESATAHTASPWLLTYTDSYYRGKRCDPGDPGVADGWRYEVSAPQAGVVFIERTRSRCRQKEKYTEEQLQEKENGELAMELAEDGKDVSADRMATGGDVNENGVPDYLDVAAYADTGDVRYARAEPPYDQWETSSTKSATQAELIAVNRGMLRLTRQYGDLVARKLVDSTVRAMFSAALRLDADVLERELARQLTGTVIERELTSVVGKGTAAGIGNVSRDAGIKVIQRGGVRYAQLELASAEARPLARLLVRYATRLGLSSTANVIPVVGQVVMVVLDVYFTAQLLVDMVDLLGYNIWGDPHLVTLDRRIYDLQSAGEFVLARTPGGSHVQGRFLPSGSNVSIMRRAVLGTSTDRFELVGSGGQLNGEPLTLDGFTLTESGLAVGHVAGTWIAIAPDGLTMMGNTAQDVRVVAPDGVALEGLLGNNDGDAGDDLALPNGTPLTSTQANTLHGAYADAWRITPETSLFTYAAGESTASFTDRAFPANIVTLGDFAPAEIDAANATCISQGVAAGALTDACVLDLLVTSDAKFAAAAASTRSIVDPAATSFDSDGVLRQGFDGAIPTGMAAETTVQVTAASHAVGPFFDASPYRFALVSVPRHDAAMVRARVLVLGSNGANRQVSVNADGLSSATFSLEGAGEVRSGHTGATITPDGSGFTTTGTAYTAYILAVPLTHFGSAMRMEFTPKNFYSVLNSAFAIDSIEITLTAPPAESVGGLTVPFTASAERGEGMGRLETAGSADEYHFTVGNLTGPTDLLVETSQASAVRAEIRRADTGELVEPTDQAANLFYSLLPPRDYRLVVTAKSAAVNSYLLPVLRLADTDAGRFPLDALWKTVGTTFAGERAFVTFSGTTGQKIALQGRDTSAGVWWALHSPTGLRLDGWRRDDYVEYTLPADGLYKILVDPSSNNVGDVTLRGFVYPATDTDAGTFMIGGAAKAIITTTVGQNATATFEGRAGQKIQLQTSGQTYPEGTYWNVLKPDGSALLNSNHNRLVELTLPVAGTYTFHVDPPGATTGSITVKAWAIAEDVQAGSFEIGGDALTVTTTGPGQQARATFEGRAGQKIQLQTSGQTYPEGTYWNVLKPDGSALLNSNHNRLVELTLPVAGTYTFHVDPPGATTGSITVKAWAIAEDVQAGSFEIGGDALTVTTTGPGQQARATFEGRAGQKIQLQTSGQTYPEGTYWNVLKPDGSALLNSNHNRLVELTLPVAGTYTFHVDPPGATTGSITVKAWAIAEDVQAGSFEIGGDALTVTTTGPGQQARATFEGRAGQKIQLQTSGQTYPEGTYWNVLKPDGSALLNSNHNRLVELTLPVAGTYTFHVDPPGATTGSITVKAWAIAEDVQAGSFEIGGDALTVTTTGPGQQARATFEGRAGQKIQLQTSGQTYPEGTYWNVLKPDGSALLNSNHNRLVELTLPVAGTYTFHVDPPGATTGSITVKAWAIAEDVQAGSFEIGGDALTVTTTGPGQQARATFEGRAGQKIQLQTSGQTYPEGTYWNVLKPDGSALLNSNHNRLVELTLPVAGTYTFHVDPPGATTGSITVKAWAIAEDVQAGSFEIGGDALTVTTTGPGQQARATFEGRAGQKIQLQTSGQTYPEGTYWNVLKPDGSALLNSNHNRLVELTLPVAGTYTFHVDPPGATTGSITVKAWAVT